MNAKDCLPLRMLLSVLLLLVALSTAWAQEPGQNGRPLEARPGRTPAPPQSRAIGLDEAESDEPDASAAGDVSIQQLISGDLYVDGSLGIGNDSINGEAFGFDTFRMKENNLRIYFDDTSTIAGYPSTDWRLVANDSTHGGQSYFAVQNATANKVPFRVDAGAPDNALYVGSDGSNSSVGVGTVPDGGINLQVADGWTPYFRLELNSSEGWAPYEWDLVANESNFYITDPTSGGIRYPFRIYPGAPSDSLFIGGAGRGNRPGYIGMGTNTPEAALHVTRPNVSWRPAQVLIEEPANVPVEERVLLEGVNKGPALVRLRDENAGAFWTLGFGSDGFTATYTSTAGAQVEGFHLQSDGNLTIARALTEMSDAAQKANFAPVHGGEVLARLAEVPVTTWSYKGDETNVRHMGPVAQDFHAAFGLGQDERHIAPLDTNGVALAAIQELYRQVQAQSVRLEAQNARIEEQNARIARLEHQNALLEADLAGSKGGLTASALPAK